MNLTSQPGLDCRCPFADEVHVRHRPLILYALTCLINLAVEYLVYRPAGARRVSFGDIE